MTEGIAAFVFFVSVAAAAPAVPAPRALLSRATAAPDAAYQGKMIEVQWYGKQARAAEVQVFYKKGKLRREIQAHGSAQARLAVSDGKVEWIVLPARKLALRGAPSRTAPKLMAPGAERELMIRNYELKVRGEEDVAGRRAWVLELKPRARGKPRQTLWIDGQTGLILRSKRFRADGSLAALSHFVSLRLPAEIPDGIFSYQPPEGFRVEEHGLSPKFLSREALKDAVASPPAAPETLPGGFVFESAGTVPAGGSRAVHLRYTDGLTTVSLFESPVPVRLRELKGASTGEGLLPRGAVLQWRAKKRSYVLIGDLSSGLMRRLAAEFKEAARSEK